MLNIKRGRSAGCFPLPLGISLSTTSLPASFSPLTSSVIEKYSKNNCTYCMPRMVAHHHRQWDLPFFTSATSVLSLASVASVAVSSRFSLSFSFSSAAFSASAGKENITFNVGKDLLYCSNLIHRFVHVRYHWTNLWLNVFLFCFRFHLISLLWPPCLASMSVLPPLCSPPVLFSPLLWQMVCQLILSSPPLSGGCHLCIQFFGQETHFVRSLLSRRKAIDRSKIW